MLIGTWKYDYLEPVPAAEHSLKRMKALLTSDLCGWPSTRVIDHLRNVRDPAGVPDFLVQTFANVDDVALFYYVGHGQVDPNDRLCLGLAASVPDSNRRATTSLEYEDVRNALRASPARLKIVILDCCFAGLATQSGRLGPAIDVAALVAGTGACVLAASAPYASAWFEKTTHTSRPQTYFTKYLADLIEQGIPNLGPYLDLNSIAYRLASGLERDGKPVPTLTNIDFGGQFEFARNKAYRAAAVTPAPAPGMAMRSHTPVHDSTELGDAEMDRGRPDMAIPHYEAELARMQRRLPDHDAAVLSVRNKMTRAYLVARRPNEIAGDFEQNYQDCRRALGENNPETFTALNYFAIHVANTGNNARALEMLRIAVAGHTQVLGPSHRRTLQSRLDYAVCAGYASGMKNSLPLFTQVIDAQSKALGEDHIDTLMSRISYSGVLGYIGSFGSMNELTEATRYDAALLADCTRVLGADHPYTTGTRDIYQQAVELVKLRSSAS